MMRISSGIGEMKRISLAAFRRESKPTAWLEPLGCRRRHPLKIAEIYQAVAGGDQIEFRLRSIKPCGDLGHLQPVINASFPCQLDHLRRKIDPRQVRRALLQANSRQPRSATNIQNFQTPGIADLGPDQLLK